MKKILILMMLALVGAGVAMAKKNTSDGKPDIVFAETTHDFGTISEDGGYVTHEFTFTNTGTAPLVILGTSASCGCTTPKAPKHPVAPGKSAKVAVTYSPKGRPGEFTKTVTVRSNVPGKKKSILTIKGFVKPGKTSNARK